MKIAYCLKNLETIGGLQKIVILKANWLANHGFEVVIILTDGIRCASTYKVDEKINIIDLKINYIEQGSRRFLSKIYHHFYNTYIHRTRLKKVLDSFGIDIVISTFGNEMGILSNLSERYKKILEFHGSKDIYDKYTPKIGLRSLIDKYYRRKMYRQINAFDRFVILSENEKDKWNINNTIAIPNALFDKRKNNSEAHFNSKKVVAVGRLEEEKDFETMIKIWKGVDAFHGDWRLYIYGDGSLYANLQDIIEQYQLKDKVFLAGHISDLDIIYKDASIYIITSKYEGFSLSTLEACEYGLPIVAFECGGEIPQMVRDGANGFLIKDRDSDAFIQRIIYLIEHPIDRESMGQQSKTISHNYSVEPIMAKWVSLFKELKK